MIYDAASLVCEDQAAGPIQGAHLLYLFELTREVGAEGFHSAGGEPDAPAALIDLGGPKATLPPVRVTVRLTRRTASSSSTSSHLRASSSP